MEPCVSVSAVPVVSRPSPWAAAGLDYALHKTETDLIFFNEKKKSKNICFGLNCVCVLPGVACVLRACAWLFDHSMCIFFFFGWVNSNFKSMDLHPRCTSLTPIYLFSVDAHSSCHVVRMRVLLCFCVGAKPTGGGLWEERTVCLSTH